MEFKGTNLTVTPSKHDVFIDSGYDTFSKNTTVTAPDGWSAVFVQNDKHACNGTGTFTIASKKKSGLKVPLFGKVKTNIYFLKSVNTCYFILNDKTIEMKDGRYTLNASVSFDTQIISVSSFLDFIKKLKLKPNTNGVMFTTADINYIIETVIKNFVKPGSAGYPTRQRTKEEEAYLKFVEDLFHSQLLRPFGFTANKISVQTFKLSFLNRY